MRSLFIARSKIERLNKHRRWVTCVMLCQAFFTNSDFSCIGPNPSILQSMS